MEIEGKGYIFKQKAMVMKYIFLGIRLRFPNVHVNGA